MERIRFEFDASFALLLWFGLLISFMRKRSYVFFSFCFYGYNIVTRTKIRFSNIGCTQTNIQWTL